MRSKQEFDDYLQKLALKTKLEYFGWNANVHDAKTANGPVIYVYLHDILTEFSWMASVDVDMFHQVSGKGMDISSREREIIVAEILRATIALIHDQSTPADLKESERDLVFALTLYAGSTATYKTAKGLVDGGNFFVNLYRKNDRETMVRPYASPVSQAIDWASYLHTVRQVIQLDRHNHPEWFL